MISNVLKLWYAKGCPTTPESIAHAKAVVDGGQWHSFKSNYIDTSIGNDREPVTLSSDFYCSRKIAFALGGDKGDQDFTLATRGKFDIGNNIETSTLALIILAFHWHPDYEVLNPLYFGHQPRVYRTLDGDEIGGRPDFTFRHRGKKYHADIKSMMGPVFSMCLSGKKIPKSMTKVYRPPFYDNNFGRRTQLCNYALADEESEDSCFFIGVSKDDGKMFEEQVFLSKEGWHMDMVEPSYAHAKKHVAAGTIPDRPPWATERFMPNKRACELENSRCTYCSYRARCWPEHELTLDTKRPAYRRQLSDDEYAALKAGQ